VRSQRVRNKKYSKSKSDNTWLPLENLYVADYTCYLPADNVNNQFFYGVKKAKSESGMSGLAFIVLLGLISGQEQP